MVVQASPTRWRETLREGSEEEEEEEEDEEDVGHVTGTPRKKRQLWRAGERT
jgi:hypothetical protein